MLLFFYRSFILVIVLLFAVLVELQVARGLVAYLGMHGVVGLTTFVVNLLVSVGIAAGTDYGIFSSAGIKRRDNRAKPGNRPITPPSARSRRWSWPPA